MKPVKAWAWVHKDKPYAIEFTKPTMRAFGGVQIVRVEIREVKKRRKK